MAKEEIETQGINLGKLLELADFLFSLILLALDWMTPFFIRLMTV